MKSNKIGILTFYNAYNYGAFLQTFALVKLLEEKYDVHIIEYTCKEIKKSYSLIKTDNIKKMFRSILFFPLNIMRRKNFKKCINESFKISSPFYNYNAVIVGSDQVWNIKLTNGYDGFYSLENFENVKRISYAASVGEESLIFNNVDIYKKILNNIDYISVREESAKEELQKLTNKEINVCLDPTLLLSKKQWSKYINKKKYNEKYIFSYFVGVTKENYDVLNSISDCLKIKVISYSENPKEKNIYKHCYTDGPFDFISKLKNSELVFTSSFHATVFSIIFNVQFYCMPPKKRGNRIRNLLEKLDLSDRIIEDKKNINKIMFTKKIDYENVNKKLSLLREESINWINEVLEESK